MGNREYHYLPWENYLQVAQGAGKKVAADGTLLPFYGNTVIFDLDDSAKEQLKQLQDELYRRCGHFLSEKLTADSFHVTLHDLLSGTDREEMLAKVNEISSEAKTAVEDAKRMVGFSMPMQPTRLVSMVSTSVVLLLEHVYHLDKVYSDMAYEHLQSVVPLDYGFTPHVTLGYYRPGVIAGEDLQLLADMLSELSQQLDFKVVLKSKNLKYQEFWDMNHYGEQIPS